MTRAPLLLVAAGLVVLLVASPERLRAEDRPSPPPLEASEPRFDAGRVEAGTAVHHTYVLRNHGQKILQILAKPSCGCTTTDYDRTIAPGDVGTITARLDTTSVRGRVEKHINVTTNDP